MDSRKITDPLNRGMVGGLLGVPAELGAMFLNGGRSIGNLANRLAGVNAPPAPMVENPVYGQEWWGNKMQQAGMVSPQRNKLAEFGAGLLDPSGVAKAPVLAKGLFALGDPATTKMLGGLLGATVWQGSPHKFNKFDSSKIGTGEGAQSYGNGMYVAEQKAVGQEYAKRLSSDGAGYLYKIDLPDEHIAKMLDWDKPLSQQPQAIQDAVKPLLTDAFDVRGYKGGWGSLEPDADAVRDVFTKTGHSLGTFSAQDAAALNFPGSAIVKALGNMDTESAATAQLLRKQGLTGIRYLDGGSRTAGAGSSNFVVFPGNENLLKILERNGKPIK